MMETLGTANDVGRGRSGTGTDSNHTVSDRLAEFLFNHGVRNVYGLLGGAALDVYDAMQRSELEVLHFRHETGAAFAAMEAYFATGSPGVVLTTTGPGLTNALTGMTAARYDGAKVLLVSAATGPSKRGRWAFQETGQTTMGGQGLFCRGSLFHDAALIDHADELEPFLSRLATGFSRPGGFVAHLSLSPGLQASTWSSPPVEPIRQLAPGPNPDAVRQCAEILLRERVALWVGHGARHAAPEIRELAERCGCPVMATPRGKGIVPGIHPQFLGVTGFGGHSNVRVMLTRNPVDRTMVLGSRLGEMSSFWQPYLVGRNGLVHVDVDPSVFGAAYPSAQTVGVVSEIRSFVRALLDHLPAQRRPPQVTTPSLEVPVPRPAPRTDLVNPRALMESIQTEVVEGTDAIVMTEAGNAFVWGTHCLRFPAPGRYRVSMGFGSMGHATTGVVGASHAAGKPAVAIVGDGAMLMSSELSTAVHYGIPAIWVVLNDARFGLVDDGMRALGYQTGELGFPRVDFAAAAQSVGARGITVSEERQVAAALREALTAGGPVVVDVRVDPGVQAPFEGRNATISDQSRRQS